MLYVNRTAKGNYVELDSALDPESNFIGTTWEDYTKGAWILLSANLNASKESMYVFNNFAYFLYVKINGTTGWKDEIFFKSSAPVDLFFLHGKCNSSNNNSANCLGELILIS